MEINPGGANDGRGRERQPTTSVPSREMEFAKVIFSILRSFLLV